MLNKMSKIGFGTPMNERILLYWERSQHFEDGMLLFTDNHEVYHQLFDGESLNDEPTHWSYLPEIEK